VTWDFLAHNFVCPHTVPAQICLSSWRRARSSLSKVPKYYFASRCSPGRKWGNPWNWNLWEECEYACNLHTCKVQMWEH